MEFWAVVLFICAGVYGYSEQRKRRESEEKATLFAQGYLYLCSAFKQSRTNFTLKEDDGTVRSFVIQEVNGFDQGQRNGLQQAAPQHAAN